MLGVAYKRDIDDVRESPALDIIRLLSRARAPRVSYHDPHVPQLDFEDEGSHLVHEPLSSVDLVAGAKAADLVVIVTEHTVVDTTRSLKRRASSSTPATPPRASFPTRS